MPSFLAMLQPAVITRGEDLPSVSYDTQNVFFDRSNRLDDGWPKLPLLVPFTELVEAHQDGTLLHLRDGSPNEVLPQDGSLRGQAVGAPEPALVRDRDVHGLGSRRPRGTVLATFVTFHLFVRQLPFATVAVLLFVFDSTNDGSRQGVELRGVNDLTPAGAQLHRSHVP